MGGRVGQGDEHRDVVVVVVLVCVLNVWLVRTSDRDYLCDYLQPQQSSSNASVSLSSNKTKVFPAYHSAFMFWSALVDKLRNDSK